MPDPFQDPLSTPAGAGLRTQYPGLLSMQGVLDPRRQLNEEFYTQALGQAEGLATGTGMAGAIKGPGLYSALERVLESKMPSRAVPNQVLGIIKGGGVKEAEIKSSGIVPMLEKAAEGDVPQVLRQSQVLQHVQENTPQLRDHVYKFGPVMRGGLAYAETGSEGVPKWDQYRLPGGKNYREVVTAMQPKEVTIRGGYQLDPETTYFGGHYSEVPNTVLHRRLTDRVDVNGQPSLHIEELQSDWAQQGKKYGFAGEKHSNVEWHADENGVGFYALSDHPGAGGTVRFINHRWEATISGPHISMTNHFDTLENARAYVERQLQTAEYGGHIPHMPFEKNWHELGMRKTVLEAVQNDVPAITWNTGQQIKQYAGMGLKHAENLYDKAMVNYMNDLGKRWGVRVDTTDVSINRHMIQGPDRETVHRFVIPDAMRRDIQREGLPMFGVTPPVVEKRKPEKDDTERKFQEYKSKLPANAQRALEENMRSMMPDEAAAYRRSLVHP